MTANLVVHCFLLCHAPSYGNNPPKSDIRALQLEKKIWVRSDVWYADRYYFYFLWISGLKCLISSGLVDLFSLTVAAQEKVRCRTSRCCYIEKTGSNHWLRREEIEGGKIILSSSSIQLFFSFLKGCKYTWWNRKGKLPFSASHWHWENKDWLWSHKVIAFPPPLYSQDCGCWKRQR